MAKYLKNSRVGPKSFDFVITTFSYPLLRDLIGQEGLFSEEEKTRHRALNLENLSFATHFSRFGIILVLFF